MHNVVHALIIMDEYLEGVLALLERDTLRTYPATSMSRSIHEGVLVLCRTFDSDLSTDQRLVRMAALDVKTRVGALDGFRSFAGPPGEDELRLREHTDQFITYLEGAGFEMSRKQSRPELLTGITWAGFREDLDKDGTTGASRTYTPDIHFNWVIGSAATHSKKWFMHGQEGSTDESVKALILPLLDLSRLLMRCLGTYFGIDVEQAIKTTGLRMRAILLHDAEQTLTSLGVLARANAWDVLNTR
ncbi:hypothetical protein [Arthrobacter sp. SX1312]|uniref:hypothetical protein n=1 Tax=Arthrobacter sp. SX1312 TaxID=2058896 RepID=UPI0011B017B0|nr:hypothetical protein [Arthrobacter sp. SX1312]